MSADCGKLKNSNCFRRTHKGDFPKFGHIYNFLIQQLEKVQTPAARWTLMTTVDSVQSQQC